MQTTETVQLREFMPAFWLLVVSVIGSMALALSSPPKDGVAAVVAPPGSTFLQTVAIIKAADGLIVRTGGLDNVVIAQFKGADYSTKLKNAGAWFVTDPLALGGCGASGKKPVIKPSTNQMGI